ncbi:MAG: Calx-beta domain-containing protein [Pseudomonadota bacterium]
MLYRVFLGVTCLILISGCGGSGSDGPPRLSINSIDVSESSGTPFFTVSLSDSSTSEVSVSYTSRDSTALAGIDYEPVSGILTFSPGTTRQNIPFAIVQDLIIEDDKAFQIVLSDPNNATIETAIGTARINDDDGDPIIALDNGGGLERPNFVPEGDSATRTFSIPLRLSFSASGAISADYTIVSGNATLGEDFPPQSGSVQIPGTSPFAIDIQIAGDEIEEETEETLFIRFSNLQNLNPGQPDIEVRIIDDDGPPVTVLGNLQRPEISADGSRVAGNWCPVFSGCDVYRYDTSNPEPIYVAGNNFPLFFVDSVNLSFDGRFIAFSSDDTAITMSGDGDYDAFVHDVLSTTTNKVSVAEDGTDANAATRVIEIARNGDTVAFSNTASNLVANVVDGNQVYTKDLASGAIDVVSVNNAGVPGDADSQVYGISSDSRLVLFTSAATNLTAQSSNGATQAYLRDRTNGETLLVSQINGNPVTENVTRAELTDDAELIYFMTETSPVDEEEAPVREIYVVQRATGTTTPVTFSIDGVTQNIEFLNVSRNGRFVLFSLGSSIYARDTWTDATRAMNRTRLSPNTRSFWGIGPAAISDDGSWIVYQSRPFVPGGGTAVGIASHLRGPFQWP